MFPGPVKKWHIVCTTVRRAARRNACEKPGHGTGCDAMGMCRAESIRVEGGMAPLLRMPGHGVHGEALGVTSVQHALARRLWWVAVGTTVGALAGVPLLVGGYPARQCAVRLRVRDWSRYVPSTWGHAVRDQGTATPSGYSGSTTRGRCVREPYRIRALKAFFPIFVISK